MQLPDPRGSRRNKADVIAPAVVIPWRDEGDKGASLKYTLRGLRHLPHEGVLVVGDALPGWACGVANIVLPDQPNRWEDSQMSVLTGVATVGGWAYIMHDDMIVSRPVEWIAPSNRGPLALYRNRGNYYDRARKVSAWLRTQGHQNPLNFNVHAPFLVDTSRYLDAAAEVAHLPAGFRASVYGNLLGLKTRRVIDPKVSHTGSMPHPSWPIWSLSDRSFEKGLVGRKVKGLFSDPGPYDE